jgi:hypothetical protein
MNRTKVVFRKFYDGQIIALFYAEKETAFLCSSYMHIGQHSTADAHGLVAKTKPATPGEYTALANELRGIGYVLDIRQRITYNRWGQ